jgi:hypothetical protein
MYSLSNSLILEKVPPKSTRLVGLTHISILEINLGWNGSKQNDPQSILIG